MALLPRLARELLGEDLALPSVRTWWCGTPADRTYVLERLAHLVIRPLCPHGVGATVFGATLDRAAREHLAGAIRARPHGYAAQEVVALSTVPRWRRRRAGWSRRPCGATRPAEARLIDDAHLAIACLRSLGLAARYVSGYLETLPPPGGARLQGADASHAWFAVPVPGIGWVDFDPTNDCLPGPRHVTTAWRRDDREPPAMNQAGWPASPAACD